MNAQLVLEESWRNAPYDRYPDIMLGKAMDMQSLRFWANKIMNKVEKVIAAHLTERVGFVAALKQLIHLKKQNLGRY